jgi:pimeloyl-ACP methyl ester carboxylesterase
MLAAAMLVPAEVRRAMMGRPLDIDALMARLRLPVLVTHGLEDRFVLPAAGRQTAATIPGASLSLYEAVGHTPFQEDAARFNAELAAFAEACRQG